MGNEIDTSVLAFLASRLQMHYSKVLPPLHCVHSDTAALLSYDPNSFALNKDQLLPKLGGSHDLNGRKEREFGMKKEE
uniref:Uncharacterized protein n=1 Tax=Oryza sativa subsp. japonica TaxID=39947 RepID=Q5ZC91_ORYSJ|nr:hypothetical protein [Oryza sativa Japonica Group]BAD88352.1 hypothetical protein [Oryza sativa Japonica Group]